MTFAALEHISSYRRWWHIGTMSGGDEKVLPEISDRSEADDTSVLEGRDGAVRRLAVLVRSGVLTVGRPDRTVRRLAALAKWGPTLAGSFAAAAARDPHRTAVIDDRRSRTYGEINQRVERISAGLAALGITADTSVAMLTRNSAYAVEAMVSTARTGANILLLNTFLAPAQIKTLLERERAAAVIVDAELLAGVEAVLGDSTVIVAEPDGDLTGHLTLDELAGSTERAVGPPSVRSRVIILTSGTTGTPKGAKRGAPKGLGPAASMMSRIPLRAREIMFIAPPLFHTWGLGALQLAPAINSTIVLRRNPDPQSILAAMGEHRCTSLIAVPVMLQRMLDVPVERRTRHDTSALRIVACSSAPLSRDLVTRFREAFGDVLYNVYGSSEVSWATIATPADLRLAPGTVGRPPLGTRVAVLDDADVPVRRGEVGRIFVANELLFEGYTNGVDKQRAHGLMATGDRGFVDGHGLVTVLGRDDDMIISGGENVYPVELQELLIAQEQVRDVAVVGMPDAEMGQRLAAYVVLHEGVTWTADEVRELVRGRLARFSVPRAVVFLDELPRNATGKVVPRLLPAPAAAPDPSD
jgi:acyl-CoA synthetase (AMP-forming)/AMP-acid ligase II